MVNETACAMGLGGLCDCMECRRFPGLTRPPRLS